MKYKAFFITFKWIAFSCQKLYQTVECIFKDPSDFINKTKNLSTIPDNAILVTVDLVGFNPIIPDESGLRAFREVLDKQDKKCIPTDNFVLKNNFFELDSTIKHQVSGTAINTKFALPQALLFMNKFEAQFLEMQQLQPLILFK